MPSLIAFGENDGGDESFSSGTASSVLSVFIFPNRCCVIAALLESLNHVFEPLRSGLILGRRQLRFSEVLVS